MLACSYSQVHAVGAGRHIVYLGGEVEISILDKWTAALHAIPNNTTLMYNKWNPGYQEGAMMSMSVFFEKKWWHGYEWIVRLNPDTFIYNDTLLKTMMFSNNNVDAVLANCEPHVVYNQSFGGTIKNFNVHTDFFAVRPEKLPPDAFSDWQKQKNAERQASHIFANLVRNRRVAWILRKNRDYSCRVRGSGLCHENGNKCEFVSSDCI